MTDKQGPQFITELKDDRRLKALPYPMRPNELTPAVVRSIVPARSVRFARVLGVIYGASTVMIVTSAVLFGASMQADDSGGLYRVLVIAALSAALVFTGYAWGHLCTRAAQDTPAPDDALLLPPSEDERRARRAHVQEHGALPAPLVLADTLFILHRDMSPEDRRTVKLGRN